MYVSWRKKETLAESEKRWKRNKKQEPEEEEKTKPSNLINP